MSTDLQRSHKYGLLAAGRTYAIRQLFTFPDEESKKSFAQYLIDTYGVVMNGEWMQLGTESREDWDTRDGIIATAVQRGAVAYDLPIRKSP